MRKRASPAQAVTLLRRAWPPYWRACLGLGVGAIVGAAFLCTDVGREMLASLLSGRQLATATRVLYLGKVHGGAEARASFGVRNVGLTSVRLLGVETDCACILASDLPCTLAPFVRREIEIIVRAPQVAETQRTWHVLRILPDRDGGKGPLVTVTMDVVPPQLRRKARP